LRLHSFSYKKEERPAFHDDRCWCA